MAAAVEGAGGGGDWGEVGKERGEEEGNERGGVRAGRCGVGASRSISPNKFLPESLF